MQQFTIPQFIDVEDKIIGPITTRQFIIMLGGIILIAIFYKLFDFTLFVTASVFDFIIAITFAFVKINGRPFHLFILNVIQTLKRPKLRVWGNAGAKIMNETEAIDDMIKARQPVPVKHYATSRLAELSLMVDTGGAFRGDDDDKPASR